MSESKLSLWIFFLLIGFSSPRAIVQLSAQEIEVEVATENPPHYVGQGAVVQLTVDGLDARPDPSCLVESENSAIRTQLLGISPRIMQQVYSSGGQLRRIETVTHTIQLRVIASTPGEYEIGPFVVSQNGKEKRVDAIRMSFQDVPTTDNMRIKLLLPEIAYPDQRVPVTYEWWFAGNTDNLNSVDIVSPLPSEFSFAPDAPPNRQQTRLPIQTSEGTLRLAASLREEKDGDKDFTVLSAQRTLIPDRPGVFELAPVTATIEVVTEWQQGRSGLGGGGIGGSLFA